MSKSKNILEIRNVTKKFNTPNNKVLTACDNISLEFKEGKILAIVGESGCGKSTLMKMIVQLEEVTSGEILYGGEDITKLKGEKLRQNRRHIQCAVADNGTNQQTVQRLCRIIRANENKYECNGNGDSNGHKAAHEFKLQLLFIPHAEPSLLLHRSAVSSPAYIHP